MHRKTPKFRAIGQAQRTLQSVKGGDFSARLDKDVALCMPYEACPLCGGADCCLLRSDPCQSHPLWQEGLPLQLIWMHCQRCEHVYTRDHFTAEGLALLFSKALPSQVSGVNLDQERARWYQTVERVQRHLDQPAWLSDGFVWLDVGCGSGGLVVTAAEYGFAAIGLDSRRQAVDGLNTLGYTALMGNLMELDVSDPVHVVSLADVLEHVSFPREALKGVHAALVTGGLLVVSCPNLDSGSWRKSNVEGSNPYWGEIEHHHNFSRASLMRLLAQEGFHPIDYSISTRYKSCMEVVAKRV